MRSELQNELWYTASQDIQCLGYCHSMYVVSFASFYVFQYSCCKGQVESFFRKTVNLHQHHASDAFLCPYFCICSHRISCSPWYLRILWISSVSLSVSLLYTLSLQHSTLSLHRTQSKSHLPNHLQRRLHLHHQLKCLHQRQCSLSIPLPSSALWTRI